jgi:ParB family chromosome partitioning protein
MMFFQKDKKQEGSKVLQIEVKNIVPNPRQPRHTFDKDSLISLSESIKHNGILQPLTVRETEDGFYELVAGERRLRAAIIAGYSAVPCIPVTLSDNQSAVMALLENLQREDLNFFDEAVGIQRLIEQYGMSQEEVAVKLGKTQSTIANKLRLLRLTKEQRERILQLGLTERHARAVIRLCEGQRDNAIFEISHKNLNVEETDKMVNSMIEPKQRRINRNMTVIKDVRIFFNTINNAVTLMQRSGIEVVAARHEYSDYYEYTVKIPKSKNIVDKTA